MNIPFLFQGLVVGFTIAATVGPISLLTAQRTLLRGWRYGWVSGMGVALADALYGFIGGLGLTVVTDFFVNQQTWLRLVGGAALVFTGLRIAFRSREAKPAEERPQGAAGYLGAFTSIFFLTLSNPMTILLFAAVYTGMGMDGIPGGWTRAGLFGLGIFVGSGAWWLMLTGGVNLLRSRFQPAMLGWINRVTGAAIAGFGAWILIKLAHG